MVKVLITSPRGKERLVSEFEKYAQVVTKLEDGVNLIIPTVDEELPFFASAREWFASQNIAIPISSSSTIDTCRDKAEFYRFCRRMDFPVIPTMQEHLIAKPRFGKGSKGIIRLDRSYIVQPIVDDPEYSIDYFADFEGKMLSIIPRLRLDVVNGESRNLAVRMHDVIIDTCERLGKELSLVGHNVIQGFFTGKEFVLSEVNPRFGGGSWMTFPQFNSPKWLCENTQWRNVKNVVDTLRE